MIYFASWAKHVMDCKKVHNEAQRQQFLTNWQQANTARCMNRETKANRHRSIAIKGIKLSRGSFEELISPTLYKCSFIDVEKCLPPKLNLSIENKNDVYQVTALSARLRVQIEKTKTKSLIWAAWERELYNQFLKWAAWYLKLGSKFHMRQLWPPSPSNMSESSASLVQSLVTELQSKA